MSNHLPKLLKIKSIDLATGTVDLSRPAEVGEQFSFRWARTAKDGALHIHLDVTTPDGRKYTHTKTYSKGEQALMRDHAEMVKGGRDGWRCHAIHEGGLVNLILRGGQRGTIPHPSVHSAICRTSTPWPPSRQQPGPRAGFFCYPYRRIRACRVTAHFSARSAQALAVTSISMSCMAMETRSDGSDR